ncbi:hypothetical protein BDZ45DRAFT_13890 [Acephala macrosclerotiorum]|nr:hypothetical protein BDZ45DRAFT_13890 [Acephala macrosclerotiorum]
MSYYDSIHNLFLGRLSSLSKSIILSALKQLKNGKLTIHVQEQDRDDPKETLVFGTEKPEAEITIRSKNVWTRMVVNLDLGLGEAYMLRELECDDPVKLLLFLVAN